MSLEIIDRAGSSLPKCSASLHSPLRYFRIVAPEVSLFSVRHSAERESEPCAEPCGDSDREREIASPLFHDSTPIVRGSRR